MRKFSKKIKICLLICWKILKLKIYFHNFVIFLNKDEEKIALKFWNLIKKIININF